MTNGSFTILAILSMYDIIYCPVQAMMSVLLSNPEAKEREAWSTKRESKIRSLEELQKLRLRDLHEEY